MKTLLATMMVLGLLLVPTGDAVAAEAKEHKIEVADLKYKPAKLTVKKGDKVIWVNSDDRDHTVVARAAKDGKDKKEKPAFDSGKIAAGDKFEFKFEKAGKFEYGCEYHPRMRGLVEVTD